MVVEWIQKQCGDAWVLGSQIKKTNLLLDNVWIMFMCSINFIVFFFHIYGLNTHFQMVTALKLALWDLGLMLLFSVATCMRGSYYNLMLIYALNLYFQSFYLRHLIVNAIWYCLWIFLVDQIVVLKVFTIWNFREILGLPCYHYFFFVHSSFQLSFLV